jgi:hypothetical protein
MTTLTLILMFLGGLLWLVLLAWFVRNIARRIFR